MICEVCTQRLNPLQKWYQNDIRRTLNTSPTTKRTRFSSCSNCCLVSVHSSVGEAAIADRIQTAAVCRHVQSSISTALFSFFSLHIWQKDKSIQYFLPIFHAWLVYTYPAPSLFSLSLIYPSQSCRWLSSTVAECVLLVKRQWSGRRTSPVRWGNGRSLTVMRWRWRRGRWSARPPRREWAPLPQWVSGRPTREAPRRHPSTVLLLRGRVGGAVQGSPVQEILCLDWSKKVGTTTGPVE